MMGRDAVLGSEFACEIYCLQAGFFSLKRSCVRGCLDFVLS